MIVYIESNFVLELAREQEQVSSAKAIIDLAESGKIQLLFPGFALSEPFSTVIRQGNERNGLYDLLKKTLEELKRSEPYKQIALDLEPVIGTLKETYVRDLDLLHTACDSLLSIGKSIETDISSFRQAVIYQGELGLKPQDSIIYSAIISDMRLRPHEEAKCFLSRDTKAFNNPRLKAELKLYNCRYMGSFKDGLSFIERFA